MAIVYFISGEFYETTGTFVSLHKYICLNIVFIRAPMIKIEDFFHSLIPNVMIISRFHSVETKSTYSPNWRSLFKDNWRYTNDSCSGTTCNCYSFLRRSFLSLTKTLTISRNNRLSSSNHNLCYTYA